MSKFGRYARVRALSPLGEHSSNSHAANYREVEPALVPTRTGVRPDLLGLDVVPGAESQHVHDPGMDQALCWVVDAMKLWIDNEKDPALAPQFGLDPAGWIVARSPSEAIALIRSTVPDEIALDWDLGWGDTGEDVILAVANLYGPGRRPAPKVTFISAMDESNILLRETWQEAMVHTAARGRTS